MNETTDALGAAREGRIVVVGHDPDELRRLSTVLEPSGRRIVTVGTGGEARREIVGDEPAVVVLDTRTASDEAVEVVEALRAAQAERRRLADEQAGEHRRVLASQQSFKNEFFALVSHELLTPLTSIVGYLEELLSGTSGGFNQEQEHDLEVIDRNARRLYRLVDDLMFVAQVEAGMLSLDRVTIDLATVVLEAIDVAQPSAKRREVQLVAHLDAVGPVTGDARRLGQVVDNLLSNAVKFSHPGGLVEVAMREQGDEVVIEVVDEGLGIPLVEQPRVFDRFARSSIASAGEIPGIGLGLSISEVIVEAHGGSIGMDSVEGVGSTFTVRLPLEAPLDGDDDGDDQE
jgi:signal transduction histidine kinase